MKLKRTASFFMAMLLAIPAGVCSVQKAAYAYGSESIAIAAPAADEGIGGYYYAQLPDEAKNLYEAMYNMYRQGILKTGTEDYDLVANGHVTQEQLDGYANGNMTLLSYMGAARDAFYADYPEIFYVDFSYLSMRVTRKSGRYCAYLGPGRSDTYFTEGFTSQADVEEALALYESRMEEIVEGAKKISTENGKNPEEQKVSYVHDELIRHTSYRLENSCKKENIGHIRTVYGALVKGESLCEGYSRAMKAVLDRIGVPCILVQGGFMDTQAKSEPHMWNYVKIEDKWYGVDATIDDPIGPISGENGMDGFERSDYLLVGADVMSRRHIPDGVMSGANFEFSYPELEGQGRLFDEVFNTNGLKVLYNEEGVDGELKTGIYKVSYNGMGAEKTIESGKYILIRETVYYPNSNRWERGEWAYVLPDVYMLSDTESELTLSIPNAQYVEFAITSQAPGNYEENPEYLGFHGDDLLFDAYTEVLYNPSGTYTAPPYVKKATPSNTSRIYIGQTYHITLVYDEVLRLADGVKEAGLEVSVLQENTTAMDYCKVQNFVWNGSDTVEFDFTPSEMWLDDTISYVFAVNGLIGVDSAKAPKSTSYTASYRRAVCAYRSRGFYYNMFGRPQLLDDSDLSKKNLAEWKTETGEGITPEMVTGLTLVTTSLSHAQTDTMNGMIESTYPGETVLKSETYNISLLTCNQNILKAGDSVRLSVGFPAGYGPDDEGVTFKAYHFIRDNYGEITGVEEVPCVITRYGLVITCKSFSPFAIVAVKEDGKKPGTSKSVVPISSWGGSISGAEGILTLSEGESRDLTIQAEDGYVIDTLVVGGRYQNITNNKTMTLKASYQDLSDGDIIEVQFVAESVREKEEQRGETVVKPVRPVQPEQEKPEPEKPGTEDPGPEITSPAKVTGLKVSSVGTNKVTLKWEKAAGAESYEVLCYDSSKKKFVKVGETTKASYTDKKKSPAKPYRYKVKACKKANGKTCYGKVSAEVKVLTKPKVPAKVAAERLTRAAVRISFKPVNGASTYEVYKYEKSSKKYQPAYQVKGKKLYKYNSKTGKWSYLRKINKTSDGQITARLTGMKQEEKKQRYYVRALVAKKGYLSAYSSKSKVVKVK